MEVVDWIVLAFTLVSIVVYGMWKTRKATADTYISGGNDSKWLTIGLSVMATQASAITFLSVPGQAYDDGMRFIQIYFGLPIALIIVSAVIIPIYYRLKVVTAYEYLESRFDLKTRMFTAALFLIQRGLAAGITIYAPAIILTSIIGIPLTPTIFIVGILVIIYTVSGGTKAVSITQKWQMTVIMAGMGVAFGILMKYIGEHVSFGEAVTLAGAMEKMNMVDLSLDFNERYTIWSGVTGGVFLALSYFGTDQSQVQRYLTGKSLTESRLGLMFNALLKIPMQFFILFVGIMMFVFYQFIMPPVHFNQPAIEALEGDQKIELNKLQEQHRVNFEEKKSTAIHFLDAHNSGDEIAAEQYKVNLNSLYQEQREISSEVKRVIASTDENKLISKTEKELKDTDYIFISFIIDYLPAGIVGLLIAVIFSAAMSSTAGELNALSATLTVDFYKRVVKKDGSSEHYRAATRWFVILFGGLAIGFAVFARLVENLIEAVNILGSIFYGPILGIFLVAFFMKFIRARAIFFAGLLTQTIVIISYAIHELGFLWYNAIGSVLVVVLAIILQQVLPNGNKPKLEKSDL